MPVYINLCVCVCVCGCVCVRTLYISLERTPDIEELRLNILVLKF